MGYVNEADPYGMESRIACARSRRERVYLRLVWSIDLSDDHQDTVVWEGAQSREEFERMHFDSVTHYQFAHFTDMNRDYAEILEDVRQQYALMEKNRETDCSTTMGKATKSLENANFQGFS